MIYRNSISALVFGALALTTIWQAPVTAADIAHGKVGTRDQLGTIEPYCGDKEVRAAVSHGFAGTSWGKISRAEFELEAARCPNIVETAFVDAQGSPEKQIADLQSLAAQGYDIIVTFPSSGEAVVRAMRNATKAGATVVGFATGTDFAGEAGKDYLTYVTDDNYAEAKLMAEWLVEKLDGEGNVLMYGGTPGNSLTASELRAVKDVFAENPGMVLLEDPVVTNWSTAQYNTVTNALLAKYPKIDAIFADYGLGVMGALRAFQAAERPLPLLVSQDANELACFYLDNKANEPNFEYASINYSGPWFTAWALRKGMAHVQGIDNLEPTVIQETLSEDSTDPNLPPKCFRDLPPDALPSNTTLTHQQLKDLFAE